MRFGADAVRQRGRPAEKRVWRHSAAELKKVALSWRKRANLHAKLQVDFRRYFTQFVIFTNSDKFCAYVRHFLPLACASAVNYTQSRPSA